MDNMILGLGHPRTGTGFTSYLLSSWGLDVGHECLGKDGIVAWQLISPKGPYPWLKCKSPAHVLTNYSHLIYNVRNPISSIPSIVYTEDIPNISLSHRIQILGIAHKKNPIELAIESIVSYDKLVTEMRPDITYRIEHDHELLFEYINSSFPTIKFTKPGKRAVNKRGHDSLDSLREHLDNCSIKHRDDIDSFCEKHRYPRIFNR